jgi:hypothetical protein
MHSATAAPSSPRALRAAAAKPAPARRTHAHAKSSHGSARKQHLSATVVAPREAVATPQPVVDTPAPAPAATQTQTQTPTTSTAGKPKAQTVKDKLTDLREQVLAAIQQAQAIAGGGAPGAIDLATKTLDSSLATLRPMIERVLASVGLSLPALTTSPTGTTTTPTTTAPSLPTTVLQPVQQVLDGVDSLLGKLFKSAAP